MISVAAAISAIADGGLRSTRAAIGARLKVTVATAQGQRAIYKPVNAGGSFGANPRRQEIGLGEAIVISGVEIFWPTSGLRQTLTGLQVNHAYRIQEGATNATELSLQRFSLAPAGHAPAHQHHADHQ